MCGFLIRGRDERPHRRINRPSPPGPGRRADRRAEPGQIALRVMLADIQFTRSATRRAYSSSKAIGAGPSACPACRMVRSAGVGDDGANPQPRGAGHPAVPPAAPASMSCAAARLGRGRATQCGVDEPGVQGGQVTGPARRRRPAALACRPLRSAVPARCYAHRRPGKPGPGQVPARLAHRLGRSRVEPHRHAGHGPQPRGPPTVPAGPRDLGSIRELAGRAAAASPSCAVTSA